MPVRKPIQLMTGHIKKDVRDRRLHEESLVATDRDQLDKAPDALFNDLRAKREYNRLWGELKKIDALGNLDRNHLVVYANAYSMYMKACQEIKKPDFEPVVQSGQGVKPNPWFAIQKQARQDMAAEGKALGLDPVSRLKLAAKIADEEDEGLKEAFGDI